MEKLTFERARERGLVSRGARNGTPKKEIEGPKLDDWRSQNWLRRISTVNLS